MVLSFLKVIYVVNGDSRFAVSLGLWAAKAGDPGSRRGFDSAIQLLFLVFAIYYSSR
jgi:hypothetical protein